ncbi:MAG TPA: NAD(P)/FAD-dependent oxidoreductase [Candidatus Methylomirabilis sp.]|nr:NAD(P)/FAD-dependent oxidoreductase [Candidatus Methylomirabilis sp.]
MRETEIVIVGAGPAGLAAALEAAAAGAETLLIDEYHTLGGQFYKQVPEAFSLKDGRAEGAQYAEGAEIIQRLRVGNVETLLDTLVWGIFDERTLAIYRDGKTEQIRAGKLILASGAQEAPVAFPGWTLPGVMLGGAAQALMVNQRILPGERVVLAGAGPLQLKVASQFIEAGAEVVDILEASSKPPMSMENALRAFGHWGKMREGLEYWLKLKTAGAPYHHHQVPVRAAGHGELEAVVVAEVDADWRVIAGTERTLQADTLCLSYGFLPANQLPRLVGCRMEFDPDSGGWVTQHDEHQETSRHGVYVAGEVGGIGGADVAEEEGRIAAMAAVQALGKGKGNGGRKAEEKTRARLAEARKFAQVTRDMMRLKPALFDLITDETIVCRCEEVAAKAVRDAIADGDPTVRGVKIRTRAGMGQCQGRICGSLVSRLIAKHTGVGLDRIEPDTPRPPVKPVPLSALAAGVGR